MKNIYESSENFEAAATIAAGYYLIRQIQEGLNKPKSPIAAEIDRITGYGAAVEKKAMEDIIVCMEDIIEAKKFLEDDYSTDVELMNQIIAIKKKADSRMEAGESH